MTSNNQPKHMTQAQTPDPLFLQAEHLAKDFSLFPKHSKQSLSLIHISEPTRPY